jgi:hypothetical protein
VTPTVAVEPAAIVKVTGIWRSEPDEGVRLILPVYVPAARPVADTATEVDDGVAVPLVGVAVNQVAVLVAVHETEAGEEVRFTVCAGTLVAPAIALKVSEVGLPVKAGVWVEVLLTTTLL